MRIDNVYARQLTASICTRNCQRACVVVGLGSAIALFMFVGMFTVEKERIVLRDSTEALGNIQTLAGLLGELVEAFK
jgi:hypothetical protein